MGFHTCPHIATMYINSLVIIEKGFSALTMLFASESWDFCRGRLCLNSVCFVAQNSTDVCGYS